MLFVTPQFWKSRTLLSTLLRPVSWLYRLAGKIRNLCITPANVSFKTICIGNITVGGSGKTPVALAIGTLLTEYAQSYSYLSKGYGGRISAPTPVDLQKHRAEDVGDEPLLLAQQAPTIVSKNWKVGAEVIDHYSDIVIMDDGLQNPGIKKDLSLLVINGAYGIGNGLMFPAGPLRESLAHAQKHVDAVIIIGDDQHNISDHIHVPIINAEIVSQLPSELTGKKVLAFAGIAHPEKFFQSVVSHDCTLVDHIAFPDHHPFTKEELDTLVLKAQHHNAQLLTTEKDFKRIPSNYHALIQTLPITIHWSYKQEILGLLRSKIIGTT